MIQNLRAGPTLAVSNLLLQKLIWNSSFCDIYWDITAPREQS